MVIQRECSLYNYYSPLSSPFSSVSSRASVSEVAGCNRRSCHRYAVASTADATERVPVAVAKTEHPAAVTCTRGFDPGWTANSAGSDLPPRAPSIGASTGMANSLWTIHFDPCHHSQCVSRLIAISYWSTERLCVQRKSVTVYDIRQSGSEYVDCSMIWIHREHNWEWWSCSSISRNVFFCGRLDDGGFTLGNEARINPFSAGMLDGARLLHVD